MKKACILTARRQVSKNPYIPQTRARNTRTLPNGI